MGANNYPQGPPSESEMKQWQEQKEIESMLARAKELMNSGILWGNTQNVFYKSVLIELLINMKDLIKRAEKLGFKVNSTADMRVTPLQKINDISDLICNFRDAACHSDSYRRKYNGSIIFSIISGKLPQAIIINGLSIGNPYEDDIAYNYGEHVLFLKRHIEYVFNMLTNYFESVVLNQHKPV